MKLDRSKPFAEVFSHPKAKYEQFGRLYDATGESLDSPTLHVPGRKIEFLEKEKQKARA